MGTAKIIKRTTLKKQFAISLVMVIILSFVTFLTINEIFQYHLNDFNVDKEYRTRVNRIIKYVNQNVNFIWELKDYSELEKIIGSDQIDFYLLDKQFRIVFSSKRSKHYFYLEGGTHSDATIIPIIDKTSGELMGTLVFFLNIEHDSLLEFLGDVIIPFLSLVFYTLLFAGILSAKIRKPLNELMTAATKIKNRDLDFAIPCDQNNEIGDLARALEDMRSELKDSLIREWQLEHDRRDMVAALTHDLRTPLAIIQGHIEGALDGLMDNREKLANYLQTIAQNTSRVKNLVDEMNLLVEVDSEGFELHPAPVNLEEFVKQKIDDLKILASKKDITIDLIQEISTFKNNSFILDSNRLAQVMDNIIGNSIRFTPTGGLIAAVVNISDTEAVFKISDNGPGFSEKDLPNLFKKFYKGDSSRSLEKGHSGLGLYIAKLIIEKHGGMIKAANQPKGGALVEFSLKYLPKPRN